MAGSKDTSQSEAMLGNTWLLTQILTWKIISNASFWLIDGPATGLTHYSDVLMGVMASQITGVLIICPTVCSGADEKASKLRVTGRCEGINRWPVDSPHKGPVSRKMFPFDDIIMHEHFSLLAGYVIFCTFYRTLTLCQPRVTSFTERYFHFLFMTDTKLFCIYYTVLIPGLNPAIERRRYKVTLPIIGCTQT